MYTKSSLILFVIIFFFLASCKKDSNITLLGYKYELLRTGTGKQAKEGDQAYFNIVTVVGDSIVDDTHIYPFQPTLRLEVIPPTETAPIVDAMKNMKIGDSIRLHIPIDSLPFAKIEYQSFKEIVHLITLDALKTEEEFKKDIDARNKILYAMADSLRGLGISKKALLTQYVQDYNNKKLDGQLKSTEKWVKYIILNEGQGMLPKPGYMIEVNYAGSLTNEFIFDDYFNKGQPYVYRIHTGQVIKGWDDVLSTFKEGTEAIVFIPSDLGYGATGSSPNIPPHSELVFYLNLYKVRPMANRL